MYDTIRTIVGRLAVLALALLSLALVLLAQLWAMWAAGCLPLVLCVVARVFLGVCVFEFWAGIASEASRPEAV